LRVTIPRQHALFRPLPYHSTPAWYFGARLRQHPRALYTSSATTSTFFPSLKRGFLRAWRFLHTGLDRLSSLIFISRERRHSITLPAGTPPFIFHLQNFIPPSWDFCATSASRLGEQVIPQTPRTALLILSTSLLRSCSIEIPHRCCSKSRCSVREAVPSEIIRLVSCHFTMIVGFINTITPFWVYLSSSFHIMLNNITPLQRRARGRTYIVMSGECIWG